MASSTALNVREVPDQTLKHLKAIGSRELLEMAQHMLQHGVESLVLNTAQFLEKARINHMSVEQVMQIGHGFEIRQKFPRQFARRLVTVPSRLRHRLMDDIRLQPVVPVAIRYICFWLPAIVASARMPNAMKVLCVGIDPQLLESRRLLLQSAGFEASCHFPHEALAFLPASAFDLLVVSVGVGEEDREALTAATPENTRLIQLQGFVAPQELLKLVSHDNNV